jgi:hypothetical protein
VFRPAELDHKLTIVGDIGVLGGVGSFLVPTLGGYTVLVELERSSLITGLPFLDVAVSTRAAAGDAMVLTAPAASSLVAAVWSDPSAPDPAPTAAEVADAVWNEPSAAHVTAGSFGELQGALAALSAQQITLVREVHRLFGLDATYVVEHGETYIRVPADGSLINIRVTKTATTARFERL